MKILFAASEVFPLAKTGGLADVSGALPTALAELGADVRVVTPAYRGTLEKLHTRRLLRKIDVRGQTFDLWEGHVHGSNATLWVLDCPALYGREGDPYHDATGNAHPDNHWRFGCFCDAIARLSMGRANLGWKPDVVHLNDWQTGLVAAWLSREWPRPRVIYTIHNAAHQGQFGRDAFNDLWLPPEWWSPEALEFHHGFSFMKGGIVFADAVTTVSPTYAAEIQTAAFGHGMDGLLRARRGVLSGILNGIDDRLWNPARDPLIAQTYSIASVVTGKRANKLALQNQLGLQADEGTLLVGVISRLAHQKGSDLLLEGQDEFMKLNVQFAILGAGDKYLEQAYRDWASRYPGRIGLRIGYDEAAAHQIEAGVDVFLMPSRFEPCGLNQMYSQRYGTVPVVRKVGGLADTVTDTTPETLEAGTASGVLFEHADVGGVRYGLQRALELYRDVRIWDDLQRTGMTRDFSWRRAAREYLDLYAALPATAPAGIPGPLPHT